MSLPEFRSQPVLEHGPPHAPLIARLHVELANADRLRVRILQKTIEFYDIWTISFPVSDSPFDSTTKNLPADTPAGRSAHTYILLGFHPTGESEIMLEASGPGGVQLWQTPLHHKLRDLPASPLDMPPLQTHHSEPARMAGNFTYLTIRRRAIGRVADMTPAQRDWFVHWGMLIAIDNLGQMRWMRKLQRRAAGIERLANGNLFVHDTEFCSREIDMAGDTIRAWYAAQRPQGPLSGGIPVAVRSLHHQPHQMPNGNFLALSAHARHIRDWPASVHELNPATADKEIIGDMVVEFTPDGEIVWSWDSFDHLDLYRIGYDALDAYWHVRGFPDAGDWTHGNGVSYDARDDSVLLSLRLQDCVLKIDRKSGDIVWILGDHQNWSPSLATKLLTPVGEPFRWPWHMHNPRITSEGTIVLFDNHIYAARPGRKRLPFHKSFSRGVEYRVNEENMTVEQVWSSALVDDDVKERTWAMGDAHRLEESDTALVIHSIAMPHGRDDIGMDEDDRSIRYVSEYPSYARILEYNRKDIHDILFDFTIRDENELIQWEIFSAVRVADLYPSQSGIHLESGDTLLSTRSTQ